MLAIEIDSEYKLDLDMYKVLKMLSLHELEETILKNYTIRDNLSREEKLKQGIEYDKKIYKGNQIFEGLVNDIQKRELLSTKF